MHDYRVRRKFTYQKCPDVLAFEAGLDKFNAEIYLSETEDERKISYLVSLGMISRVSGGGLLVEITGDYTTSKRKALGIAEKFIPVIDA